MSCVIASETPLSEDAARLIAGSEAALREVYTAEECFTFTAKELARPEIRFFVLRENNYALGCVALAQYEDYGEVKRLFVDPSARGRDFGRQLMDHLENDARGLGLSSVKIETGDKLAAAVRLYKDMGYNICGPFGTYEAHPASLFMQKNL